MFGRVTLRYSECLVEAGLDLGCRLTEPHRSHLPLRATVQPARYSVPRRGLHKRVHHVHAWLLPQEPNVHRTASLLNHCHLLQAGNQGPANRVGPSSPSLPPPSKMQDQTGNGMLIQDITKLFGLISHNCSSIMPATWSG
jgi:hypothetical protein